MTPVTYALMVLPVIGALGLVWVLLRVDEAEEWDTIRDTRIRTFAGADYLGDNPTTSAPAPTGNPLRTLVASLAGQRMERTERGRRLTATLARADLKLRSEEWIFVVAAITAAMGGLAWLRFRNPIVVVVVALLAYVATGWFLGWRIARRLRKFESGLGETLVAIANALKAGYAFGAALKVVSEAAPYPLDVELGRVVGAVALGAQMDEALDSLAERNRSEDVELIVAAIKISRATGGNLAEVLDSIEETIRGRIQVKGQIRTLTAQARASGYVISILPIALAALLTLISPAYFTPMFTRGEGIIMLIVAGFGIVVGSAIIRKIVAIKV